MAGTKIKMPQGLDVDFYPRGPTRSKRVQPPITATHPNLPWVSLGLLLLVAAGAAIALFWEAALEQVGYAMAPVGGLIIIGVLAVRQHPKSLIFRANRWLALVVFAGFIFALMAFFEASSGTLAETTYGGQVGTRLIGAQDTFGLLRLIGFGVVTITLFAPIFAWRVLLLVIIAFLTLIAVLNRTFNYFYGYLMDQWERRKVRKLLDKLSSPINNRHWPTETDLGKSVRMALTRPQRASLATVSGIGVGVPEASFSLSPSPAKEETKLKTPEIVEEAEEEEGILRAQSQSKSDQVWGLSTASRPATISSRWALPTIELLDATSELELHPVDHQKRAAAIEEALASHGIEAKVVQINPGPTVTQFGIEPGWFRKYREIKDRADDGTPIVRLEEVSKKRVKVDQIAALDKDLALALAASSIRIEAPVPGKSLVGIEVPNSAMGMVGLREAIESPSFQKLQSKTSLAVAMGKGSAGEVLADSLGRMPHLLIAGATGSGKSVCITSLISCLLMHNTPDDLRLILVDPKRVELVSFSTIPHLITPVVVEMEKVIGVLKWTAQEMDRRYKVMASAAARNIEGYNKKVEAEEKIPYLVVVIDELADLMSAAPFDVEQGLTRLAQMGRATGIHLVVATQRPSVDVITGLIKANFPTRASFAVTSMTDSRVILDMPGAEKLLGRGDMLYLPSDAAKPKRLQGVFVSEQEVERLVYHWSQQNNGLFQHSDIGPEVISVAEPRADQDKDEDPFLAKARELAMGHNTISTSLLQRKLGIGYPRAARLIDELEEEGLVGPGEPGKSRQVLKS